MADFGGAEEFTLEWVGFAGARRRCRPEALAASFLTGCAASGFS